MRAFCFGLLLAPLLVACSDDAPAGTGGAASSAGSTAASGGAGGAPIVVDSSRSCGHAHNDYEHERPLLDALDHGFCSVEADVFLVDGALLVGHTESALDPTRTLQSLYLDPLRSLAGDGALERDGVPVGPHGGPLQLLIDVKTSAEPTWAALDPILASYSDILTEFADGTTTPGAVTAVISGGRAQETMAAAPLRYAAIDGRIGDESEPVAPSVPASLVPLVSQNWVTLFAWLGDEPFSDEQQAQLLGYVQEAHASDRLVRFWSTPDTPATWAVLAAAEVDLINVDDLAGLQAFKAEHD
ncbi:MAG: phosphatidylinositol-specific phospholipase C/glycerophosphodiester phosphodiesterase family protein [Polyangiaceae bacterium]